MQVAVAYAEGRQQAWLRVEVPESCTAGEAIALSGVLERFPHIDLEAQKIGVFGKLVKRDAPLKAGDRVEIYRPVTADPEVVVKRDSNADE